MNKTIMLSMLLAATGASAQTETRITEWNLSGPFAVTVPVELDSIDVNGKKFDEPSLLNALSLEARPTKIFNGSIVPSLSKDKSVGVLSCFLNNTSYLKGTLKVKGPKHYKLYIDGKEVANELKLAPEHHTIALKFMAEPNDTDTISVTIVTPASSSSSGHLQSKERKDIITQTSPLHPYMVHDLTDGKRVRGLSLSADGKYAVVSFQTTERGGKAHWDYELREVRSLQVLRRLSQNVKWMPRSIAYIEEETVNGQRTLYKVDALTGSRTNWVSNVPKGSYTISPTEDYLIISTEEEGPKEDEEVYEVVEMDDRQPGWRNRNYLMRYDVATGLCQRITFGAKGQWLADISLDGTKLLVCSNYSRLSKRPTEVMDVFVMDARSLHTDTLLQREGFLSGGVFSPDGNQVLFKGNPEAFNRIGCELPANTTPSMTEYELFLFDIASKKVTPFTKHFNPSIENFNWCQANSIVYFSAEDRDYVRLYQLDPKDGKITQLEANGDYVYRYSMASHAAIIGYLSYETMAPASALIAYTAKGKSAMKQILVYNGREALGDAEIGTCQDWNFTNSKGDTVYGRLYLPKDFDATKKYPMIVYYYGGCSPVSRYFESPYAPQMWNSLGYVAYILQPSGATGFGQEWASRHVNTAGRGPAEDIIEGTKKICEEHSFIDASKIGCMGASYGGFMTQYLQTQTDIFACAVSHAGIANHTSYWGEGYWGYNYSEVSMANSYPWSHRQLYVDQSPLFNADKIHTPLLLLHGDVDTNVPVIESLQMFTALKLLGREVALVEVKGQNHHITDYGKREKWLATQMAWFQRWLKDDASWWEALYPKKNL